MGLRRLKRFWSARTGVAAAEFALLLPVLVLLFTGAAEMGRMLLLSHKVQNGAFILADLAGRDRKLSSAELDTIFIALTTVMGRRW